MFIEGYGLLMGCSSKKLKMRGNKRSVYMSGFEKKVTSVILKADILLFVLDAREPDKTRNFRVEKLVSSNGKRLIFVINKSDLVQRNSLKKLSDSMSPCVFISITKKTGINNLRNLILIEARKAGIKDRDVLVGVLGYPNVGKSSLINTLSNRKAAPASNVAGTTRSVRHIRSRSRMVLIDTPGVIPSNDKDEVKNASIGSVDFTKVKDVESVFFELLDAHPGAIERFYGVEPSQDKEETLERIALKKRMLMKGGEADSSRMARLVIQVWQSGVIK